jgi:D-glycero-D-manno-heptose 1,7-bisphosphate phosphatase
MPHTKPQLYIMIGIQGSGKSTKAKEIAAIIPNSVIHSRDEHGGALNDLLIFIENDLLTEKIPIIDNTHLIKNSRKSFIDLGKKHGADIHCIYMKSSMEDCQVRVLRRMYESYGEIYMSGKAHIKHPHLFPPSVLFAARKAEQVPNKEEGFTSITEIKQPSIKWNEAEFMGRALFLDIDGTIRMTDNLPNKYPTSEEEVVLLHDPVKMRTILETYRKQGYKLIGISNQSGIAKGIVTIQIVEKAMNRTRELLGYNESEFPISFCPHQSVPVSCYCRKPQSGQGIQAIIKYKINPSISLMVGDQKTDETFAIRLGIPFISVSNFWNVLENK